MQHVITMIGPSEAPRLTAEEVENLFDFSFCVHDHDAQTPAQPIFWFRTSSNALWKYWN